MKRLLSPLIVTLATVSVHTADGGMKVTKNLSYSKDGGNRARLDVHAPTEGKSHAVVIYIHGGGWQKGDKFFVDAKPQGFTDRGYILVSINYRLHPAVTYKEQAGDVSRAIRWVHDHAGEFGGDPGRLFLMGHSAGAHLAALVGTDEHYLKKEGLGLNDLRGVILLDGACYDIPRQITQALLPRMKVIYTDVFTRDEATQKDASPITHVGKGKGIPPFLIVHVASRPDSAAQSEELAAKLREAGIEASVVPAKDKTHASINQELGKPDGAPTKAVFEFIRQECEKPNSRRHLEPVNTGP